VKANGKPQSKSKSSGRVVENGVERALLGYVLHDHSLWAQLSVLTPEDFHDLNRRIFCAMRDIAAENPAEISAVNVCDRLGTGEASHVASLLDPLLLRKGWRQDFDVYLSQLKKASTLRSICRSVEELRSAIEQPRIDLERVRSLGTTVAESARSSGEANGWRDVFHTFKEFEEAPPLNFAIDGFLQNDGATMIGGLSGHGKTLINLSIARALLAGKGARLWDLFAVTESAVRVVYLIPECSLTPFKHRLRLFGLYDCLRPEDGRLLVRTLSKGPTPCLSDPHILYAAKGAHVILDTAVRFGDGDENSAGDNQRGLAKDIFALLGAGARSVIGAHHSPKPFAKESVMTLEGVLRGSGDVGAMLTTCWGIKQLNADQNIIHVQNVKPRDFQPCGPFQVIGRPWINETGDFRLHKRPGECGTLEEEQPDRNTGGAPHESRQERARRVEMVREWLKAEPNQTAEELCERFRKAGIKVGETAVKNYRKKAVARDDE